LNQLRFARSQQLHLEARILGEFESENLLEHVQVVLSPVGTNLVAIKVCDVLGVVGMHDEVGDGRLVMKKLGFVSR